MRLFQGVTLTCGAMLAIALLSGCTAPRIVTTACPTSLVCPPPPVCPACPPCPVAAPPPSTAVVSVLEAQVPLFVDESDTISLRTAAWNSWQYYRGLTPDQTWVLGTDVYSAHQLAASIEHFIALIDQSPTRQAFLAAVRRDFKVYESVGTDAQKTVTFSSYYEPTVEARLEKSERYRYPLYGRPEDLMEVNLEQFNPQYQGAKIFGRREGPYMVPYYTRAEIDGHKILNDQKLEIAWAKDPVDVFYLQIEGSGWLDLGDGKTVRIRYDGTNGRKYSSVGLHLLKTGRMSKSAMSHASLQAYLNDHPKERQALLDVDERYVFFRIDTSTTGSFAYGDIDQPLTPGRSVATDPKVFPKGSLAWIETQQTVFDADGKVRGTKPLVRFVLSQDEGGAIQGPGRVDFFMGHGREEERFATHFWYPGKLYFLVKKKTTTTLLGGR